MNTGAIDQRSNHNPPTTGEPTDMPCINEEGAPFEGGTGSAAEANPQMGTQMGGTRSPGDESSHLGGW